MAVEQAKHRDYLFENPPLVEVIAEVRWRLQPVAGGQNGPAIDPHFSFFRTAFEDAAAAVGFSAAEQVLPDFLPPPVLAHKVVRRFRKAPNGYPLFQIGPGLLSINMVPPYKGWEEFASVIRDGLQLLTNTYPMPDRYLSLEQIELRYIDAFTAKHGVESRSDFLLKELGVVGSLPERIHATSTGSDDAIQQSSQTVIMLRKPSDSTGVLQFEYGTASGAEAVIATFLVRKALHGEAIGSVNVIGWFDEAHDTAREWFDALLSDRTRARLGQVKYI